MTDFGDSANEFTAEHAADVLTTACAQAGSLDPTGARLLRLGENAVFRLAQQPVVVRIARTADGLETHTRIVAVARWLEGAGYPTTRLLNGVRQPRVVSGHTVTFWHLVADRQRPATTTQLATLLRDLHALEAPDALGVRRLDPFAEARSQLAGVRALSPDDRAFLHARMDTLDKQYAAVEFALPDGLIHADASVGNTLLDDADAAVLIDLDSCALGPREWDLVQTAMHHERFGWHTCDEYEEFVCAYGFDVLSWPGYPVLADMREVMMTVWLAQQAGHNPAAAEEVARRISAIRTDADRHNWQPF